MFQRVLSATIAGVEAVKVSVETDVSDGLPGFAMVGYLSALVKEAQDRVRTALRNTGYSMPPKKITVNLAPADVRKNGTGFDLPIAVSILAALGKVQNDSLERILFVGELSLNGEIHPVTGILPMVTMAKAEGCLACLIPMGNLMEGKQVKDMEVIGVESLKQVVDFLNDGIIPQQKKQDMELEKKTGKPDFADVYGQWTVKRAVVIAAAGFHNLLMLGPPGAGKTMIAKRIPSIFPQMTLEESLEVTKIYSIAGLLSVQGGLMKDRPFRSPHHTITAQALAGGGRVPGPGEITLAHRGVLFLDEMPEFSRNTLEILRQPLEEHRINIVRTSGSYTFPAHCLLVAALNPCPCGYFPDMNRCSCTSVDVNRYVNKISQPLLDRIDLCVEARAVSYEEIKKKKKSLNSRQMQEQVVMAQEIQKERYKDMAISFNSELNASMIEKYCKITPQGMKILEKVFKQMKITMRGYHKIIKVSQTIADLDGKSSICPEHIMEAVGYRALDKKYWRNEIEK